MEVIKISPERLMVTLSSEDMEKYSISTEKIESGSTHTRTALRKILEDANVGAGFCMESARVLVQVFPSKKGGCEMFVTKLGDDASELPVRINEEKVKSIRRIMTVYSFETVDSLLAACAAVYISGYSGESFAYAENGRKRLYLCLDDEYPNLSEFGAKKCRKSAEMYLNEHCRIISSNAVKQFSALA